VLQIAWPIKVARQARRELTKFQVLDQRTIRTAKLSGKLVKDLQWLKFRCRSLGRQQKPSGKLAKGLHFLKVKTFRLPRLLKLLGTLVNDAQLRKAF
jgi:hypothetical protein